MSTTRARRGVPSQTPVVAGPTGYGIGLLWLSAIAIAGAGASATAGASVRPAAPAAPLHAVVLARLGPGLAAYTLSAQGPADPAGFAADAPDPAALAGVLSGLPSSVATYARAWQADGGRDRVQDLVVRFGDVAGAQAFLQAARRALGAGEVVSADPLPGVPGARRVTYFGATGRDGLGEAVSGRVGRDVDVLSFFTTASDDARPISPAGAEQVARTQQAALLAAAGGTTAAPTGGGTGKGVSAGAVGVAVLVVAVLALAVATPVLLRRRRSATGAGGAGGAPPAFSRRRG